MAAKAAADVDPKALKILFARHWTPKGWIWAADRHTAPADFAYAKQAGVMFDDAVLTHDEIVDRTITAVQAVTARQVADSFVASLSTRRLLLRSAFGSFAVFQHFARHKAVPATRAYTHLATGCCMTCGLELKKPQPIDFNQANFERFKWGGVSHDDPTYAFFDLEQFAKQAPVQPTSEDVAILRSILDTIRSVPAKTTAPALERHLSKSFPSNKPEREKTIAMLGYCGVIATPAHPGYWKGFVAPPQRIEPRETEMEYPARLWTGADGVQQPAVDYWFGHLL